MKATELRQKTVEELGTELDGLQLQQFKLRMAKATGQLATLHQNHRLLTAHDWLFG